MLVNKVIKLIFFENNSSYLLQYQKIVLYLHLELNNTSIMEKSIERKINALIGELMYYKENGIGKNYYSLPLPFFNHIKASDDGSDTDLYCCYLDYDKNVGVCRYNVEVNPKTNAVIAIHLNSVDFAVDGNIYDCIDIENLNEVNELIIKLESMKKDKEDITYEVCPHCGNEVALENELKVQICPSCGKHIVTCSMCPDSEKRDCANCCLCRLADELNKDDSPIMNTTNAHNPLLVELINKVWNERCHDEFKPIIKALYYRDYDECVEKSIFAENAEMWLEDWDWESCLYDYLMEVADDGDVVTILHFLKVKEIDYIIN